MTTTKEVAPEGGEVGVLKPQKKGMTTKQKWMMLGIFVACTGGIAGGIAGGLSAKKSPVLPPASPAPPGMAQAYEASVEFVASGDVADYTDDVKASLATMVATEANVPASQVTITVTSGSVTVKAAILYNSAEEAEGSIDAMTDSEAAFASSENLEAALKTAGVDVTVSEITKAPEVAQVFLAPPPSSPPPSPSIPKTSADTHPLAGFWKDDWDVYVSVSQTSATVGDVTTKTWWLIQSSQWGESASAMVAFGGDNTAGWTVYQNPADATYNPSLFSKIEYHTAPNGGIAYCTTVYNAASADDAFNSDTKAIYNTADAAAGCNGFGHSVLSAYTLGTAGVAGTYKSNFGGYMGAQDDFIMTLASWGNAYYSNVHLSATMVIAQNSANNAYNPSKYSKFRFHKIKNAEGVATGSLGYCQILYDSDDVVALIAADDSAYNASDAAAGCNGFGHSVYDPATSALLGDWDANPGSSELDVTKTTWTMTASWGTTARPIVAVYNAGAAPSQTGWIIAQNPADATYNPSEWSSFKFHELATAGTFGYCQVYYDKKSPEEIVFADHAPLNISDAAKGCNGFPFTVLTPATE